MYFISFLQHKGMLTANIGKVNLSICIKHKLCRIFWVPSR